MRQVRNVIHLLLALLLTNAAKAGIETLNNRIGGNQILNNASVSVQDSRYPNVDLSGTAKIAKASSKVIFSIDMASPKYYSSYSRVRVGLQVYSWDKYGALQLTPTIVELEVGVNSSGTYSDKSVYVINGSHKVTATIQYIKDDNGVIIPPASIPLNLALEVEQTTERYYQFNTSTNPSLSLDTLDLPSLNEIIVRWNTIPGAEEYELEWTYINNYDLTAATVPVNFKNNATRVRVSKNDYRVSMIFDRGYVVWRVRGVGRSPLDYTKELYTNWSGPESGNIPAYSAAHYYAVYTNARHEIKKNWQYSSSYAEEGKKKEVVSYFDGSLRSRQAVTKSNTTQQTLVGETIYDYQGRPAIQVLPVPTGQGKIKYYSGFNKKDVTHTIYNRADFDLDGTPTNCTTPTNPMDTLTGSAYYYSEQNADKSGFQSYTPNARQYPFTQTEFTPDNTGRIRRQGGVGKDYQLGTGHETKYYYGQPEQIQLDRLFGSEVGDYRHYKKNMVVDANGQISVSYLDQSGRTIATSLAGNAPTNVTALPGPDPATQLSIDYIKWSDPLVPNSNKFINNALVFSKELLVATAGVYQFSYDLQAPKYQDALCMNAPLCFDCIYDLEVSIKDACGVDMVTPVKQTVGTLDTICGSTLTFALSPNPLNVSLTVGNYTILKRLTISEKAIDYYTDKYTKYANLTCLTPLDSFKKWALQKVDTLACSMDCATCVSSLGSYASHSDYTKGNPASATYDPLYKYMTLDQYNEAVRRCNAPCQPANLCEAQYMTLLDDVGPGGQYAKYTIDASGNFTATDPLSVLNTSNSLPTTIGAPNWRNPQKITINPATLVETISQGYFESDGTRAQITISMGSTGLYSPATVSNAKDGTDANGNDFVYPEHLANALDFINLFGSHTSWAKSLVPYHPEYAYYKWCSRNNDTLFSSTGTKKLTSDAFDDRLRQINSYSVAVTNLLTDNNLGNPTDILSKDPYFEITSAASPNHGQGEGLRASMVALLTNYGSGTGPTLKGFCATAVRCGTQYYGTVPATCDDYGTGTAIDSVKRNQEWVLYRNMYLAEKQKLQQAASDLYAASQNRSNNCIGIKDGTFNPWVGGTTSFFNSNTPCGAYTFPLYKEKIKRFQNAGDALAQSGIDPNASAQDALNTLVNNTEYKMYQQTGQCGITTDLGFLLDAMATKALLTTTGTALSTIPSFTKRLYDAIIAPTAPGSTFLDYTWKGVVTGQNLKIQFGNGPGTVDECEVNLTLPAGNSWTNVKRFNMIKYVNTAPAGTYNFTITAYVDSNPPNPPTQVTVTGSTCINLNACSFGNNCGPSETAYQISNLLSALAANAQLTSTNVDVKASPYGNLFYNNLIPPASGTLSAVWNGTSNGSGCSLVVNGSSCTFNLAFVNSGFSFANVAYFKNLKLSATNPNTSFTVDAWVSNQFQPVTVTMSTACYNFQKCVPPPNKCTGPEYRNNDILTAGLNTIASQGKLLTNFSLSTMPSFAQIFPFTNVAQAYWKIKSYNTTTKTLLVHLKEWTGVDTTKRDSIYLAFKTVSNPHTFANIVNFSDLQVAQYSFTILAKFSDNTSDTLVGRLPITKLTKCETCKDIVLDFTVTKDGDCECNHLNYPNTSGLTELSNSSCAEGFKISTNNTCATWPVGSSHSGKFMTLHYNGADVMVWKQALNPTYFVPSQPYRFKIWFKRMTGTFDLTLKVNGTVVKSQQVTPSAYPTDNWFEVYGDWTTPSSMADVSIEVYFHRVDTGTDTYFGLDEMTMQRISPCNNTLKDPITIPYVNPCVKNLKDIATTNAIESYNAYIKGIKSQFRDNYISTCKNALENLKMVYTDREHHITLYYYDQAGNLIKTVPPEGVVKVTSAADFTQIAQDRYNKTQTYFTKHTLKTRYEYNALNQLIRQATPDQDLMNKWLLNGASTIPSTTNIYGMAFSDGNKGFVVGDNGSGTGVIYTTTDGGKTWSKVLSIGVGNLQDVQFIGTTAYAISDKGELVKSSNSGTTWTTVVTPTAQKLNDLYFSSATNGVIVGNAGTILKTSNGGTSWDAVTIDPAAIPAGVALSTINLNDLHFTSSTTGYIAGSNAMVLRTTNSGTNWYALPGVTNPMSTTVNLNAIHFLSATSGYVAGVNTITGQGVIATATINVGQTATTWTYPTVSPIASNCEFKTIHGVDANNVFAAGTNGKLYATSASSAGVFNVYSISGITGTPEITELTFTDAANPLVGFGSLKNGQLIKSTAAGGVTSWTATNVSAGSLSNPPANGIYFEATVPPYTGYLAVDGGSVLKTTDGGTTWSTISGYYAPAAALEDIYMVKNSTAGYAVGKTGYIIKTTDGGSTWNGVTSGVSNDLKAVVFEDANTGIVVGMGGKLLKVTSGSTVSTITNSPAMTNDMYDVVQLASPASTYVAVGSSGKIVKGTSSTSTWTTNNITSNAGTQTLYAVYFVGNTGFAVGSAGTIVKTTDGGNTWAALTSGVSAILREVYFKDELIGYAMGDGGVIIKTVDGGANWKVQPGTATGNFYAANFTNDGKAILGGTSVSGSPNMANLTDDSFDYGSRFWYDRLGRMVISQNSKQFNKATPAYSYTKYDEQGRIAEVGEVATTTDVNTLANVHGVVYDDGMFKTWLNAGTRSEVTTTVYDAAASNAPVGFVQENLRKRVSATYVDDDGNLGNGYVHSSIYSYDIHGNVKTLIQDITAMADFSQRYKRIDYNYDLISGSVSKVCYQPGQSDQFYHKYEYDAENRITRAFTSRDGVIWDQDAKYFYYQHGPLARVELGEDKIHANDYVYTIQGWLKGVNSNTMNTSRDPGKDGIPGSLYTGYVPDIHAKIGRDAYGYSLSYYDAPGITGDYSAINTSANLAANDFEARATAAEFVTTTPNLYNGNIKRMVSSFYDIDPSSPTIGQSIPMLSDYKYDQLNRIVEMKAFRNFDLNNNLVNTTYDQAYESAMTYDANGNLLTLKANGKVGNLNMDQLTYKYDFINNDPNQGKRSNRLYHVNDIASTYSTDIDDQGAFTPEATNNIGIVNTNNNYGYDELGNLTRDNQEQIASIGWTVYGKIKNIQRTGGSTKPALDFTYDATGNRLSKKVTTGGVPITTYYVRDAQGNIMATYERANTWYNAISTKEYTVYGSSRLGTATAYNYLGEPADIFSRLRKNKYYELSNHLGNVLSTIYDRKVGVDNTSDGIIDYYTAYVTSTSDYYPYGAPLPGRGYTATSGYRYGFNGQEKDDELSGNGNCYTAKFWEYDSRLGRRWNLDPEGVPFWSQYAAFYGMPVKLSDPEGDCPWLLVAALILTADVLVAPTQNYEADAKAIAQARRDHDIGIVANLAAPGIGAVAEKYVIKKIVSKTAPAIVQQTEKQVIKTLEKKATTETEKKFAEKTAEATGSATKKKIVTETAEEAAEAEGKIITSGVQHGTDTHWATMNRTAGELAKKGETVYLNKTINTALGKTIQGVGNWKPDVLSIAKNGVINITEVISPSQTAKEILSKVATMAAELTKQGYKVTTTVLTESGKIVK